MSKQKTVTEDQNEQGKYLVTGVIILASSAMSEYNEKLINAGALHIISKKIPEFFEWWNSFYNR